MNDSKMLPPFIPRISAVEMFFRPRSPKSYVVGIFLLEAADYEVFYFFHFDIRYQSAVRVRVSADQQ